MNEHQPAPSRHDAQDSDVVDLNERNWLPRYCRGDQQDFEQLMQAYRNLVYTFLCRYGVDKQNRDDLFQDIFLKVHQAAHRYRPSQPLRPWLISIVLNTVRNFRRDHGRRKLFMSNLQHQTTGDGSDAAASSQIGQVGIDDQLEQQSAVRWVQQRISTLPQSQREVLVLCTLQGLRMKEVAAILDLPENTVKTHLRRARLALAESLANRERQTASMGGSSI